MKATKTQKNIYRLLRKVFDQDLVRYEWNIREGSDDAFADPMSYAPRPDLAVGPFNLSRENATRAERKIHYAAKKSQLISEIQKEIKSQIGAFRRNGNPRCLLAIEIEFNGSSKHVLGSITNASMLGYVGVVVGSSKYIKKVERIGAYARALRTVRKAPPTFFANIAFYSSDDFLALLKRFA